MFNYKEQEYRVLGFCYQNDLVYKYRLYSSIFSSLFKSNYEVDYYKYNLYELYGALPNGKLYIDYGDFKGFTFKDKTVKLDDYNFQLLMECVDFHKYLDELSEAYCVDVPHLLQKTNNNLRMKTKRVQERVERILKNNRSNVHWMTFTFKDETFETKAFKKDKMRKYFVDHILKAYCSDYIANEDYGSEKERFHYHALVCSKSPEDYAAMVKHWEKFGFFKERDCVVASSMFISLYVTKLTRHAVKNTNKKCNLIFSRKK